eukprot:1137992-Pelagomonas_calceolata.AAC.3
MFSSPSGSPSLTVPIAGFCTCAKILEIAGDPAAGGPAQERAGLFVEDIGTARGTGGQDPIPPSLQQEGNLHPLLQPPMRNGSASKAAPSSVRLIPPCMNKFFLVVDACFIDFEARYSWLPNYIISVECITSSFLYVTFTWGQPCRGLRQESRGSSTSTGKSSSFASGAGSTIWGADLGDHFYSLNL